MADFICEVCGYTTTGLSIGEAKLMGHLHRRGQHKVNLEWVKKQ